MNGRKGKHRQKRQRHTFDLSLVTGKKRGYVPKARREQIARDLEQSERVRKDQLRISAEQLDWRARSTAAARDRDSNQSSDSTVPFLAPHLSWHK